MKVKDLIVSLQKHNPDLDVVCYSEDSDILVPGLGFRLFEIEHINATEAEKTRLDGKPYFVFGKSQKSQSQVILEITTNA